jgi:hypothetical protein
MDPVFIPTSSGEWQKGEIIIVYDHGRGRGFHRSKLVTHAFPRSASQRAKESKVDAISFG